MRTNLEILLSEWGRAQDIRRDKALGYPTAAAFSKERVDHDGWGYSGPEVCAADGDMLRIDDAINHLHPDMRVVITAHYVWAGPVKRKADLLKMARTAYYETLEYAHKQLSHSMGGTYATGYETKLSGHLAELSGCI
jgi:DNA-directed RNA polymerase specialized sigma24 family protein